MFMNIPKIAFLSAALAVIGAAFGSLQAQPTNQTNQTNQINPTNPPAPPSLRAQELREQLKNMSPEERRAKFEELRKTGALGLTNRPGNVPVTVQERQAMIVQRRNQQGTNPPPTLDSVLHTNRPSDRLEELRRKKRDKTITPAEQQQLERVEAMMGRMQKKSNPDGTLQSPPTPLTNSLAAPPPAPKGTR